MLPALKLPASDSFLAVEQSATGRRWKSRLDPRGEARAMAIAQQAGVPELLARVLAGRGVEPADVQGYLDPAVKRLLPDPFTLSSMREAAARLADAIMGG